MTDRVQLSPQPLQLDDVQGLIVRGYGHLTGACFLLLRVDDAVAARRWLASLPITSASVAARKERGPASFVNVALSHPGLAKLGLKQDLLDKFPREYVEGSAAPERARALGDVGMNAPSNWRWGSADGAVDVVVLLYARDDEALVALQRRYEQEALAAGLSLVVPALGTRALLGRKEHFGFRDGIAQPVIDGTRELPSLADTVAAGEFLLGHLNGYQQISHAPASAEVPFGLHGSYMVMRQLIQDVPAFWRYCEEQSQIGKVTANAVSLAAKMVGRWPSGAPLIGHPEDPGAAFQDDDDFGYAETDPEGHQCPLGAHIRRSHPRDWLLGIDPAASRILANRHRIIRRGRAYGAPVSEDLAPSSILQQLPDRNAVEDVERGLHFICFNANIERQFEFIQQHWCNSGKFAGLDCGPDPLIGVADADPTVEPTFTVPASPVRRRAIKLPQFVRVVGSGYFFMPSLTALAYLTSGEPWPLR